MFKFRALAAFAAPLTVALGLTTATPAAAQDFWLGQIVMGGWNFCPRTTTGADGQLLPISQYSALFSLYGTMYGGDGRTTFGLPDLRGRVPMHTGNGPGLTPRLQGQKFGTETVTLTTSQMPSHNHIVNSTFTDGDKNGPGSDFLAVPSDAATGTKYDDLDIYHNGPPNRTMDPAMISNTGGNLPHPNIQPVQVIRYCVVLQGIFPSRN